jgi:predicted acetyltransferase
VAVGSVGRMPVTTSSLDLRPVDLDDDALLAAWSANVSQVFTAPSPPTPERRALLRERVRGHRLSGAFDGDRLVGTYRSWDWTLTVPGGAITADAVSSVTVLPTHRRRGALTGLITADLADARERGVAAAVLIASEATIYGRFGFGPASRCAAWEVDVRSARLRPQVPREGSLEIVPLARLRELAPAVFGAARLPGATDRSALWWDQYLGLAPMPPDEPRPPRAAVVHRDPAGAPQGYLVHSWKDHWDDTRIGHSVATVEDFQAATPAAHAALWGYLTELDLIATVRAVHRPVDDPLPWLLADGRAARRTATVDFLWARLLDPVAALTARRYERPGRAVLRVIDPLGHAEGTFALAVDADGAATCAGTGAPPDVTLPVDVLSSIWLGDGDLLAAGAAGLATEHTGGALVATARLFRTLRAPWTGTWF